MVNIIDFDNGRNFFHYMDSIRVLALMAFPVDQNLREKYTAQLVIMLHMRLQELLHCHSDKYDQAGLENLHDESHCLMQGFFSWFGYAALKDTFLTGDSTQKLFESAWMKGNIAGDVLRYHIKIDRHYKSIGSLKRSSVRKAIHIITECYKGAKNQVGENLPVSRANIESYWSANKDVAHLWAAYDDMHKLAANKIIPIDCIDKELGFIKPAALETFFSIATYYRDFGVAYIAEKTNIPLLDEANAWQLPNQFEISAGDPYIEKFSKEELQALKSYRARKSTPSSS